MKRIHSIAAIALTGLIGLSTISAPIAANASEEGERNTAYALGAAAVGLLLTQHNKLPGIVAAGGAAYAYNRYNNDIQARHREDQGGYTYDRRDHDRNDGFRNGNDDRDNGNRDQQGNRHNDGRNGR
jgi:hypothetical protein